MCLACSSPKYGKGPSSFRSRADPTYFPDSCFQSCYFYSIPSRAVIILSLLVQSSLFCPSLCSHHWSCLYSTCVSLLSRMSRNSFCPGLKMHRVLLYYYTFLCFM
jgi:hypothetical protein